MLLRKSLPCALTIAGSDSGGGAGIQADSKTFAALRVHGTSVITCLTAQNPKAVLGIEPVSPGFVNSQLEAVFAELRPKAIKTGMLFSVKIMQVVASFLSKRGRGTTTIVDPVMIATSGAGLLEKDAAAALQDFLATTADVVTPNIPEAEALCGVAIREPEDLRDAARRLYKRFGCAALVKGGHLSGTDRALDIFYDGRDELLLSAPFLRSVWTHGTGCTYSAAIAAFCARGKPLAEAVQLAKNYITRAIARSVRVGRNHVLGW